MSSSVIQGETLDDIFTGAFTAILQGGLTVLASRGATRELSGVVLELSNPRSRLSRSETRGRVFSCLGELCWYLAGKGDGDSISYYLSHYAKEVDDGIVWGAYGPRLFGAGNSAQFQNVRNLLAVNPSSRRATMQIFEGRDLVGTHKDIPCTCTMQFLVREERLDLITYMRSNDAYMGLPHDVFAFTMFQEIMARSLSREVGSYKHIVGSLHLYENDVSRAELFLSEGIQSTWRPMPPMPVGDPWSEIGQLLVFEDALRSGNSVDLTGTSFLNLDPYWQDLIRLLVIFRWTKDEHIDLCGASQLRAKMSSRVFDAFIDKRISRPTA